MQAAQPYKDTKGAPEEAQIHRIRITLTSKNVKSLEKGRDRYNCVGFRTLSSLDNNHVVVTGGEGGECYSTLSLSNSIVRRISKQIKT